MQVIRKDRERASRDVPQKLEADIERAFRRFCAPSKTGVGAANALFFRPDEKAGEVWSVFHDRANAWLKMDAAAAA
jgi:hypothetical protein